MRVKILAGVAGVLVLFVAVVAMRPSAYHVERTLDVGAPAELVFGVLDDLRQFAGVLVLFGEKLDPDLPKTFEGPSSGAGQSCAWTGSNQGKLTIEESVPGQKVVVKLEFEKPMKSTALHGLTLAATPAGTVVTWSMDGSHNFLGKALGLFLDIDGMLAGDIEKGLAELKTAAESKQAAITDADAQK